MLATGTDGDDVITLASDGLYADGKGGSDVINSGGTNATIYGGDGNDTITDTDGSDTIDGGAGDDIINDQYSGDNVLRGGDGNDTITYSYQSNNTIEGGAGNDLIKVSNNSNGFHTYANTIRGGAGNDRLQGGEQADTYLFDRGDGQDTISDWDYGGRGSVDRVVFGSGIAASDITASRSGSNLVLKIADPANPAATDQITIENWDNATYRIEQAQFADGTSLTMAQLTDFAGTGTEGADVLTLWNDGAFADGKGGNDTINSGNTNATLYGGDGNDTITDTDGSDTIDGGAGDDAIADQGTGTNVLRGGDGNDSITFSYYANSTVEGGAGDDLIKINYPTYTTSAYSNILSGGAGNDRFVAGASTDTYLFNRGDGQDAINDYGFSNYGGIGLDKLSFGAGIAASDITASRSGYHMVIKIADPGNPAASDQITIENWFQDEAYRIETFQFADGSSLTAADVNQRGSSSTEVLLGGTGSDNYIVDNVNDAVFENANEGLDRVQSSISYTLTSNVEALFLFGTDAISGAGNALNNFVKGNSADNVLAGAAGNDLLQGGAGSDTLTDTYGANLFDGGADNDTIESGSGNDYIAGGGGNDTINSGTGADVIAFNRGDGQDTVIASAGQDNTLSLGKGIQYADLLFNKNNNDLVLVNGTGEQVTFKDWYADINYHSVVNLQMVIEDTPDYDAASANNLNNKKVVQFNFDGLVTAFDEARAADPGLTGWALSSSLLEFYLRSSDAEAIGGDLAYQYAKNGNLSDISMTPAQAILASTQFGIANQTLQSTAALQDLSPRLM